MLILLSPSKTMDHQQLSPIDTTEEIFKSPESQKLRTQLLSLTRDELKHLYKASDSIVNAAITTNAISNHYMSIQLFNGLVFKNLNFSSLPKIEQSWLCQHVYILSAMYGIIKADKAIRPYRLDLNNDLSCYDIHPKKLWYPLVNDTIARAKSPIIVDLASSEYRKLVDVKRFKDTYVLIDFKDLRKDRYITLGTFSKMARGLFVRELARKQITEKKPFNT